MHSSSVQRFNVTPFAVEMFNPSHWYQLGVARELRITAGHDQQVVEVLSDDDPRTFVIDELIVDTADEVRWTMPGGTTARARPLRPYDAVATRSAPTPVELDALADVVFGRCEPPQHQRGPILLDLRSDLVWVDDSEARQRTGEIAQAVAHDVRGRREIPAWRKHVPYGLLGWAPTKVPLKAANVGPSNARFVTPTVAEMLWNGQATGLRREHVISRSMITAEWDAAGPDPDALAPIIWAYRFAIVLTTLDEARRIDKDGGKVGGCERYTLAGIHTVYDRLQRCDIDVALLDPKNDRHHHLELEPW